ncbi:spore photoproduct lyase [Romboutsia weinsteinii]|uniref:Spore photoproduct lyase n=1 Tax=Romboutsia weinsteinii TaxID=2020949 RepID=A0A371IYF0_9FIRM|nr:spore photoproduct lyase [Romboutsia weinsteinii]RDY25494.1 spore photoproduct lyase [Romboutsia weinsteinii]
MFKPKRIIFEKGTLDTPMGKDIYNYAKEHKDIEIITISSNQVKGHIPGENLHDQYREGKQTLVVGIKKSLKFQSCKPSAHYQLPLVSGCMGRCEYCYLNTQLGDKPFVRVYVNIEDILGQAKKYLEERLPDTTIFEGAATSDPIPVEPYTHSLRRTIEFFANEEKGRFRFVTKYNDVDELLDINHNNHTEIRFSINTPRVIDTYEHHTASSEKRIEAAAKVAKAGYQVGFIIAPVFIYDGWQEEYKKLIQTIKYKLPKDFSEEIIFEVISHRYTTKAKNRILEIFPETTLPMSDENRKFKYGQFGYGKYVYTKEELSEMKELFKTEIEKVFPNSNIKYII